MFGELRKGGAETSRGRLPPAENLKRTRFLFSGLNLADQDKMFLSDPSEYGTSFRYEVESISPSHSVRNGNGRVGVSVHLDDEIE